MARRRVDRPKAPSADTPAAPAAPVDRAATLLDHADDANDVVQFWEENNGRWAYIERFDVPDVRAVGLEEFILQRYGGGKYKAGIRSRTAGVYGQSVVVSIAGPRKSDHERNAFKTPATPPPAAAAAPSSSNNPPAWVEKILLPFGVTFATAIAGFLGKKLLESPPAAPGIDPVLLRAALRDRGAGGEALDSIKVMQLLRDAEDRGEKRGRELGELLAGGDGDGVASAINQAAPIMNRMLDVAERRGRRRAPALPPGDTANASSDDVPRSPAPPPSDIVPAWLRPFMRYKRLLLDAADNGQSVGPIAGMVIENASEETWAAIVEAEQANRLVTDIFAALPELSSTPERRTFAGAIVEELRQEIHAPAEGDDTDAAANDA
jgi:hypothetical protein